MTKILRPILLSACCILATSLSAQNAQEASPAPAVAEPSPAVIPTPRTGSPHERFLALNERVQANRGPLDILFIGDSITQGWEGSGRKVWDEFYGPRQALNIGISGDWTQHVLWRLDHGNADGIDPKVAVILIGTNNSGPNRQPPTDVLKGVQAVVAKVQGKFPETKILLLGIFPRGEHFNNQRGDLLQVNQTLRKLADDQRVLFLDFGHLFLADDGSIPKSLMPDSLHLSPEGYRIWAETMEPILVQLLAEAR